MPGDAQIVLVLGDRGNAAKARLERARIGFDNVLGYIETDSLTETRQLSQLSVCDLKLGLKRGDVLQDDELTRLRTFPNVLITSHQAFRTREALGEIARVTVANLLALESGTPFKNGTVLGT